MSEENPSLHSSSSESPTKQIFSQISTSFVYPVRSLLTAIQPAAPVSRSKSIDHVSSLSQNLDENTPWQSQGIEGSIKRARNDSGPGGGESRLADEETKFTFPEQASPPDLPSDTSGFPRGSPRTRKQSLRIPHFPSQPSLQSILSSSTRVSPTSPQSSSDMSTSMNSGKKKKRKSSKSSSSNYRHFPAEEVDPNVSRTFSTSSPDESTRSPIGMQREGPGELPDYSMIPLPLVANSALAATSTSLLPSVTTPPPPTSHFALASLTEEGPHSMLPQQLRSTEDRADNQYQGPASGDELHSLVLTAEKWHTPSSSFSIHVETPNESTIELSVPDVPPSEIAELTDLPFNPSQYGLVHLPPLPSPGSSEWWSGSSGSSKQASLYSLYSRGSKRRSSGSVLSNNSQSIGGSSRDSKSFRNSPEPVTRNSPEGDSTGSSKAVSSREGTTSTSDSGQSQSGSGQAISSIPTSVRDEISEVGSGGSLRTESRSGGSSSGSDGSFDFRFQYAQDEHGNHVIMGREGKLQRCEDEPIRTPGAVQGFGVMMAMEDLEDILVVRQVSENSAELLGLSPHYLFSLECFTDTLPDSSAGVLWDNIQFLTDPVCANSDEEDSAPHIFTLSGWGEPGSALPSHGTNEGDSSLETEKKRFWTCWCAVHRAQPISDSKPGLIVLEFELESDTFNPLYPPIRSSKPNHPENLTQGLTPDSTTATSPGVSTPGSTVVWGSPATQTTISTDSETLYSASPLSPPSPSSHSPKLQSPFIPEPPAGLEGQDDWLPSAEDIIESTTSHSKPLRALERLRRLTQSTYGTPSTPPQNPTPGQAPRKHRRGTHATAAAGMMDVFAVMAQINDQLGAANDLDTLLKVTVGVIKDLTQFHRVMVYQFDEAWNGLVTAELVDWGVTKDLYRGLQFPAADIPKQARDLYVINKVRVLYDRSQPTARIVAKDREDLEEPLNMTHCHLRAMSPIHIKYLENMGVRASMSISIMAFGQLWGLISCHSYGNAGMRVSFPVRQMLRLLSQSISRNVERLSYAQRLYTRKLANPFAPDQHPSGCIVTNPDDLLGLFDADFAILVIGEGAKILGPNQHGQEILIMAEYLRLKQFETIQASQAVINDFPDLCLTTGLEVIAGLLYVPLSSGGKDFIALLRRGQLRDVHWAGRPYKNSPQDVQSTLEPRKSFKVWSETVAGRCRAWTDEQLETAGVLALVYGKFIEVWRQKQSALQTTKLTNLLLSNATHEVRTPLNHIINYLEMAMNGPLDGETRDNLARSHAASKSLLFTINDLLDLTRMESGNETSFNEPFNLHVTIEDAVYVYRREASRRGLEFTLDVAESPTTVVGDSRKIRTVVQNLTANALKYTKKGSISVSCNIFDEPEGLRSDKQIAVEIVVADTGCGIREDKLEKMFREFEQVEFSEPRSNAEAGVGLGLAVVARIVEQLGGQLRVDSTVDCGSKFSFLIPLALFSEGSDASCSSKSSLRSSNQSQSVSRTSAQSQDVSRASSLLPTQKEVESFVRALSPHPISRHTSLRREASQVEANSPPSRAPSRGTFIIRDTGTPIRPVKLDYFDQEVARTNKAPQTPLKHQEPANPECDQLQHTLSSGLVSEPDKERLRILIVEDNDLNRTILAKRLNMTGHTVVNATNGQEGIDVIKFDDNFDAVLMDIQMPIVNGFEATQKIRALETDGASPVGTHSKDRLSHKLNGRIPIFAVSASLKVQQREELMGYGMDGWILKPIDFKRLSSILKGITDPKQRKRDVYKKAGSWEVGGWFENRTKEGSDNLRLKPSQIRTI